jgi:hypothetical protein
MRGPGLNHIDHRIYGDTHSITDRSIPLLGAFSDLPFRTSGSSRPLVDLRPPILPWSDWVPADNMDVKVGHMISYDKGVRVLRPADIRDSLGGQCLVGADLLGLQGGESGELGDMPLWLDEEVAQVVGALVARKLGVGYVDQVVLEDSAARDVLHSAIGIVARRDAQRPRDGPPGQPGLVSPQTQQSPGRVGRRAPERGGGGSIELLGGGSVPEPVK